MMHIEIPDECFINMYEIWEDKYTDEQKKLENKIKILNQEIKKKISKHKDIAEEQKDLEDNKANLDILNNLPNDKKDYLQYQLEQNRTKDKQSLYYIFNILADYGAKSLLCASLIRMGLIIQDLQERKLLSIFNSDDGCTDSSIKDKEAIRKKLNEIFDYEQWTKSNVNFTPYVFIKSLNIKSCPYCNLEYAQIATKQLNNGKTKFLRPALDHFYPKSKFPFFALSLYNLIPTCTTCNSYIKGANEISSSYKKCIHPYDEEINYHENIRYKVSMNSLGAKKLSRTNYKGVTKDIFNLKGKWELMDYAPPEGEKVPDGYKRALENYNYFAIKERLEQGFSDYISEIYQKTNEYPEDYIKELTDKGYSAIEAFRLLLANYINPEDFNQRPLSKITHDLFEQFCPKILDELKKNNYQ